MKRSYFPLDLSALPYPMMRTRRTESNFRFSARLTEPIRSARLERALLDILPNYPNLNAEIVPSLFWHKFRQNDAPILVKEDDRPPLTPFRREDTNGYPFRLAYKEDGIVLEVFHAATDANIAALFFSDLLTRYVALGEGREDMPPQRGLLAEDAFLANAQKKSLFKLSVKGYNGRPALPLGEKGNYAAEPTLISASFPIGELKAAAKSWGATLSEYATACYIAAITQEQTLPLVKPLRIFLPIDLRRFFPSDTLLNFVCFERITIEKGESDLSFERILRIVREQFAEKITKEKMQQRINDVRTCFSFPLVKYFPLCLKQPCFKFFKKVMNKVRQTAILSNIGSLSLPPEAAAQVREINFYLNISKNAPLNVALLTYGENCRVSITSGLKKSEIPARFFDLLSRQGRK